MKGLISDPLRGAVTLGNYVKSKACRDYMFSQGRMLIVESPRFLCCVVVWLAS
jgi:hypothetical protein